MQITPSRFMLRKAGLFLAFLNALTGDNVDALVSDAFAVPVGNTGED